MFQWLSDLLELFVDFVPRPIIVRTDQELIEFVLGRWPRKLTAGWYIEWPAFANYELVPIKRDFVCRGQKFDDGEQTFAYVWKAIYDINDSLRLVTETYNYPDTIADMAEISFAEVWRELGSDQVMDHQFQVAVSNRLQSHLSEFGIRVRRFAVTSHSVIDPTSVWELENLHQIVEALR